jgi:hypothetical protein
MPLEVRRVFTAHDENGESVLPMDGEASNARFRQATGIHYTLLWTTDSTPANISGITDAGRREIGVAPPQSGLVFRIIEFPTEKEVGRALSNEQMITEIGLHVRRGGGSELTFTKSGELGVTSKLLSAPVE